MELIMIRHGKTAGNIRKAYIGSTDEPLCEEGVSELKNKIPDRTLGHVFVTSLIRTQQTAGYLFPDAKQEILPELREMDFGVFENRTAEEMRDDAEYTDWVNAGCLPRCRNGESMASFTERVGKCVTTLVKSMGQEEKPVVLVTHGGVIMALMSSFEETGGEYYSYWVQNLDGYRVTASIEDGDRLVFRNCQAIHLPDNEPDSRA